MRLPGPPLCRRLFLGAFVVLCASLATAWLLAHRTTDKSLPANDKPTVEWTFEQAERGAILSTPVVTAEYVYLAAIRDNALAPSSVVYCLDRRQGSKRWSFDDGGAMLHTISTPCLSAGRLYVGEGMHGNDTCKLYCLDATDGRECWHFVADGHIESSPCVAEGAVVFGAGDDGMHCLDAISGMARWRFGGRWHVDVSPAVVEGRVYAGSGVSERNRSTEVFCLRVSDGQVVWRTPTDLPVWGSPVVDGGQVFFGLGTGRLTQSAESPDKRAGALLCIDAASGHILWTCRVADALFARCAVDARHVYFGARDGRCRCLDRAEGGLLWQVDLGQAIVTQPAFCDGRLYVVASGGKVCCLDAENGQTLWTFDLAVATGTKPQLLSSPVVVRADTGSGRLIYLGTELRNGHRSAAVFYCLRD